MVMAWSPPRTWVDGQPVTAAQLQTELGDNQSYLREAKAFRLTWLGPLSPPVAVAEVQKVKAHSGLASGGTYTLSYAGSTTGAITWNTTAPNVQAILIGLPTIPTQGLTVTGTLNTGFTITWSAAFGDASQITADASLLVGDTIDTTTLIQGDNTFYTVPMTPTFRTGGANESGLLAGTWAFHAQATWGTASVPAPPYSVAIRKNGTTFLATSEGSLLSAGLLLTARARCTARVVAGEFLELCIDGAHAGMLGGGNADTFLEAVRIGG